MSSAADVTEFAKGNVEAIIESSKAAAAGYEALTNQVVENSKASFKDAQDAFQTLLSAKSPTDFFAAQNAFAKSQMDKAVANFGSLTESWLKLSGEVVQPLSNRAALATDLVKKQFSA